ncbi:MAG: S-layer homology domain-containing protein [Oscillospiraceae bacterium]|nr:S-layer homology domain-containing protein [Oscillospiraceae bacterium]
MKIRFNFRKVVSTLCALALTATLIPAAAAAEEKVFWEQDFQAASVGEFKPQAQGLGMAMIKVSGDPAAEIRSEGSNKLLAITAQRTYIRATAPTAKYTLSVDVRRDAVPSGLLEIWLGNLADGGTARLRVHDNGAFGVLNSKDSKNYFVQSGGAYSNGVYNANRTDPANVLLDADEWYTLNVVMDFDADTVTVGAAYQGKTAFCESVIPVAGLEPLEYVQLDGQDFSGQSIAVSIDNIRITSRQESTGGNASELIFEDYQKRTAGDSVGGDSTFKVADLPYGGGTFREVRVSGGNKYMVMLAYNSADSTGVPRVRYQTVEKFSGTFTLEWDYNNVSASRGQYFETYLRNGGNIRVRVDAQGIPRIRVLDAVKVPGVMEDSVGTTALKTNNWYTFKASLSDSEITVEIYDKTGGNTLVDTLRIAQSTATAANLLDPYNIWFDLWGKQDLTDLTPAAVAVDNFRVTMGAYEGVKNSQIATPDAVAISDSESKQIAKIKCASGLEECPADAMLDVGMYAWYHKAVDYALTNKLMSGFNFYTFGPYTTLTRAQVVQILYNKEGQPAVSGSHGFTDVPAGQWYNNAVTWGTRKGVMSGYGGGKFGPEDTVTVEQVAVILWNYAGNPAVTGDADALGPHSVWAGNALGWAQATGVLDNVPFDAVTDGANRAQTAQMLMNYLAQ